MIFVFRACAHAYAINRRALSSIRKQRDLMLDLLFGDESVTNRHCEK